MKAGIKRYFDENASLEICDDRIIICQGPSYVTIALLFFGIFSVPVGIVLLLNNELEGILFLIIPVAIVLFVLTFIKVEINFNSKIISRKVIIGRKIIFKFKERPYNLDLIEIEEDDSGDGISYYLKMDGKRILMLNSENTLENFKKVLIKSPSKIRIK